MATRFDTSTTDLTGTVKDNTSTLTLVGLGVAITVSVVAIILAAVALGRPMKSPAPVTVVTPGGGNVETVGGRKRIWTVAHGHDAGATEYFDKDGYIKGFNLQLVNKVCEAADMDCRLVWDQYTNCWNSQPGQHPMPGQGLLDRWYDACTGWYKTVERNHSLAFSKDFGKAAPASFIVKKGKAASFNGRDLAGMRIGFLDGWVADEQCLARQQDDNHRNYILPPENIVHVSTPAEAVELLVSESVNAVLSGATVYSSFDEVEEVKSTPSFPCHLSGASMMSRKDSDFNAHFNVGLQKIMDNGGYDKLCRDAGTSHGHIGDIECLDV